MTTETREQIEELIKEDDGTLAKELEKVESRDDFIGVFAAHKVVLTEEDADEMMKEIIPEEAEGELSENDLEGVAGGINRKAIAFGWGIGARVGMLGRMVYDKYKYGDPYKNYNWNNVLTGKIGLNLGPISL